MIVVEDLGKNEIRIEEDDGEVLLTVCSPRGALNNSRGGDVFTLISSAIRAAGDILTVRERK